MPLFGPPNIPQLEAKRDVQGLIKALTYKEEAIRIAAADALAPLKDPAAVDPLIGLLHDDSERVRRAAASALAARGGNRVAEPLVALLADASPAVRATASKAVQGLISADPDGETRRNTAAALGRIRAVESVDWLIKAVQDSDETVRLAAIKALQAIVDVRAVPPLIITLAHEQHRHKTTGRSNLAVERAAAQALDALCGANAVDVLRSTLSHPEPEVREAVTKYLGRVADPAAADSLVATLYDPEPSVRRMAARGLAERNWQPPATETGARYWAALREWRRCAECGQAAIPLLVSSFETVDVLERNEILDALARLDWDPQEITATTAHYWAYRGRWDKCVQIGEPAVEALDSILRSNPRWRQRVGAAGALASLDGSHATPFARIDLIQQAIDVVDGEGDGTFKRMALEMMLAEAGQYDPDAGEKIEWCVCGFPASRVRADGLREPLKSMLGFEHSSTNATTYYCPSCDTRRATVAG
jgi:HEAT repeat protein